MKVVFASHGSLGDLVPFLMVGKVLAARGHTVTVATHASQRAAVEGEGLAFYPMRPDRPADPAFHARMMHPRKGPPFIFKDYLGPAIAEADADLSAAAAGADVLVSVTLAMAAPIVAARTGIAWRSCIFQPSLFYSAEDPPRFPMLPFRRGRPGWNRTMLRFAKRGIESWAEPYRRHRRAAGLGQYADHPVFGGQHSPGGVLALYSPQFGRVAADAPPGTVQTGQVLQESRAALDPAIARFMAAGPAPIVFTLGSASALAARRFFDDSARIARKLGRRALLLTGQDGAAGPTADGRVLVAGRAPYEAVFRHAALVVNQGGIGTISLALAAERPMVCVPFAHDQLDNAVRTARLGAARVVPRWRYGLAGTTRQIADALADEAMAARAAAAGAAIRAERGAEAAADAILAAAR